jgi:twitching motility protein PilT
MAWIDALFQRMVSEGASDLHMTSDTVPMFRLHGDMLAVDGCPVITPEQMQNILFEIAPDNNKKQFLAENDTDFAYAIAGLARFRCNLFRDRKGPGAVFRQIPTEILTAEQLGLPKAVMDLCHLSKGLVVVTGPTGSGKSTTLAAMVDHINRTRNDHIITIEDPIEFVHDDKKCRVNQREVHRHTQGFKRALRAALREDPDIVLVGEMRDLETVEIAIETAETGHLVFGTLHTNTAMSTVDRVIDQFPADRQAQIRTMLASSLKGVIAQTLCKRQPKGRVAALEIMIVNSAISANIRDGKTHQLVSAMQTGAKYGMRLLNDSLEELVRSGVVEPLEAYLKSISKEDMKNKLEKLGAKLDLSSLADTPDLSPAPATGPAAGATGPRGPLPAGGPASTAQPHGAPGRVAPGHNPYTGGTKKP